MGLKPQGFIAALLAAATLLTGGTTAFAAGDTAQGLSGDVGDTTNTAGGGVSRPSATPSTGVGGDAATGGDANNADAKTGTDAGDTGSDRTSAPKAAPTPQARTKTATPDTSGEHKGTIHVEAQESSSLDGVTVRLYRVGRYPKNLDRSKSLSWDDLHATAVDDTVKGLAAKAVSGAGMQGSGDPVDVLWRSTDGAARTKAATELGEALLRAGVKPTASTVGDEQEADMPEGVYLGVPDTTDRQANISATTVDGADRVDGGGFGWMTVMGRFDGASPELADMPDDVRDGNEGSGLLGRLFGMFRTVPRTGDPFTLLGHRDYYLKPDAATGIFDLRDDTTNKPVTALCVQAGAATPDNGTKYTRYDYSWNTAQEDRMRAVVYFSPYGPGTNVMRLPKGDKALGYMHYVFSAIHNNREDDIPASIRNSGEYKALRDAAKNHPQPYTTGIRLMFYSIDPNIKNKQNLIFFDTAPRWTADVSTNAMYANSGTNGWRKVSQDRPARIFSNRITTGSRLRDEITITARGNTHFRDDYFTIESHLNVDENRDGRPDKSHTYLEIHNELILKDKSASFLSPEATPGDLGYGKAWPAGANIWWDTVIRPARAGDPGYDGSNGNNGGKMWKSFLKSNVTYLGYSTNGTERPSEAYSTPTRPSIVVSTFRRNANDGVAPAGDTAPMHDSITVRHNGGNSIASAKNGNGKLIADVTLHADLDGDGKEDLASAAKRTTFNLPATFSATQARTFDSEEFTPSDLKGQTKWQSGAKYWFDAVVYGQDSVNWFTLGLQAVGTHSGVNDPNEQFQIQRKGTVKFSTKALSGTDANPTDPPAVSGGVQRVRDRLYATCADIPAGATFTGTLTLNWSKDGDNAPEQSKTKNVSMTCGASWSPYYAPADLGMSAWAAGKYWFSLNVPVQTHVPVAQHLLGFDDSAESWTAVSPSVSFATRAQNTFNIAGNITPVSDLIWTNCTNIPDGTTFTGTGTLNLDTNRDGKADHAKSVTVAPKCGKTVTSPTIGPKDLGVGDQWPAGFYWWDLTVPKQGRYVLADTGHQGRTDAKESWTAAASRLMTAGVTSQAEGGLVAGWDQSDVTDKTRFDSNAASLLIAGGTETVSDRVRLDVRSLDTPAHRDWDTNNDGRFDGSLKFTVRTTMHLTGGKSKAKTIAYSSYHSVAGGNDSGTETFTWTPADFGLKSWPAGDAWFTSQVTGVTGAVNAMNVACPAGQKLVGSKTGEYRLCLKDYDRETSELNGAENIHFTPRFTPSVTSRVESAAMSDGNPPRDAITVNLNTRTVTGLKVTARADVYWTPDKGTAGATLPANRRHVAAVTPLVFPADGFKDGSQTITYDPAKDPAMKNVLGRLGTGYVTYVWRIDRTDLTGQSVTYGWDWHAKGWTKQLTFPSDRLLDMGSTVSDGWRPGREQAEQTTGWWLKITKIGYLGHDANGAFQPDRPAKGAVLNMQETTDQTGKTPVAGATVNTITLSGLGEGTFPYHRIRAGQTRWYKVWESKAPTPLQVPQGGAYWIVKAVNTTGSQGATLTVTGSSDETKWLLKGQAAGDKVDAVSPGSGLNARPNVWRQTLGDTIIQGVTPPVTGGSVDPVRLMGLTLAGVAAVLAVGCAIVVCRRNTVRKAGRHTV